MVKRLVAVACLLGLVSTLAACGEEQKEHIGWPCNLLTEEEVREAFGVAVTEDTTVADGFTVCEWNGSGETDETIVEIRTAPTLDLVEAYGDLDDRAQPAVRDGLAFATGSGVDGDGQTVVLADKGRSLGIQCRHLAEGGRWEDGACAELAEKAIGRVEDEDLDPKGKVAPNDACDLLTREEVRDLVGVALVAGGVEEDTPLGERGIQSFECQWVEPSAEPGPDRDAVSVWVQLRLAEQCDEPIGGTAMFEEGGVSYTKVTDTQARVGAAKGDYCVHLLADKTVIYRYGGELTDKEAGELLDSAVERLDAA